MARTKEIKLFYYLTPTKVIAPPQVDIDRKNEWIKEMQAGIPSEHEPVMIENRYKRVNPDVENQISFFNGPVIKYYAIQNDDLMEGEPEVERLKQYRGMILDDALGYDTVMIDRTVHERLSTTEFTDTQDWHNFLETLKEGIFYEHGYEFPNSERFNEIKAKVGYVEAERIVIAELRKIMATKQ